MLQHLTEAMPSAMCEMPLIGVPIIQDKLALTMLSTLLSATLIQGIVGILDLPIDFLDGVPSLQAVFVIARVCIGTTICVLFDQG